MMSQFESDGEQKIKPRSESTKERDPILPNRLREEGTCSCIDEWHEHSMRRKYETPIKYQGAERQRPV